MNNSTVLIVFGGASPEHEVSVLTGIQALSALRDSPYQTVPVYISKTGIWYTGETLRNLQNYENLDSLKRNAVRCHIQQSDAGQALLVQEQKGWFSSSEPVSVYAVVNAMHGASGENGAFQGLCEFYHIPCTGSGVLASSIGMDKLTAKNLCRHAGIPVVADVDFTEQQWVADRDSILHSVESLGYPVIVKPVSLGSSIGVERADDADAFAAATEQAFRYDSHIMAETLVSPLKEINCSVLGTPDSCEASVCERPLGKEELLSFQDKYQGDEPAKGMASASREIPADIPADLSAAIQNTSKEIFTLFGASGVARLDFLVHAVTNEYYFNEINTIPGSFSFYLWKESNVSFQDLLQRLITDAVELHQQKSGRTQIYETNLLSQKAVKGLKGLKK